MNVHVDTATRLVTSCARHHLTICKMLNGYCVGLNITLIHVFLWVIKSSHFGISGVHDWIYVSLGSLHSSLWDTNLIIWNKKMFILLSKFISVQNELHFIEKICWVKLVSTEILTALPTQAAISAITLTASRSRNIPFICWVVMCMVMTSNSILDNLEKMKESYNFRWLVRQQKRVKRLCDNSNNGCENKREQELRITNYCKLKTGTNVEGRNKDKHGWWDSQLLLHFSSLCLFFCPPNNKETRSWFWDLKMLILIAL